MKRTLAVLAVVFLLVSVPAMAAEVASADDSYAQVPSLDVPILPGVDPGEITVPDEGTGSIFNFDLNFNGVSQPVVYATSYLTVPAEGPRDGLAGLVSSIFGEYTPRTYQTDTVVDGVVVDSVEQYVPGLAGLDYEWLAGVALFGVMLFCFLKMIGGLLK